MQSKGPSEHVTRGMHFLDECVHSREEVCWIEGEQLMQRVLCNVALHGEHHNSCEQAQHAGRTAFPNILGPAQSYGPWLHVY